MNHKFTAKEGSAPSRQQETEIRFGDVYLMRFSGEGSEQCGYRPGVVFQNNVGNNHSPNIIALPITSNRRRVGQPTHVELFAGESNGLSVDSIILCENPERMSKRRLGKRLARLSRKEIKDMAIANALASSALGYLDYDELISVWKQSKKLNGILD